MPLITLYTRRHCCLCDEAKAVLSEGTYPGDSILGSSVPEDRSGGQEIFSSTGPPRADEADADSPPQL